MFLKSKYDTHIPHLDRIQTEGETPKVMRRIYLFLSSQQINFSLVNQYSGPNSWTCVLVIFKSWLVSKGIVTFFLSCSTTSFSLSNKEWLFCGFFSPFTDHKSQLKHNGAFFRQNWYFVTKLFWPTVRKKCSSDWEKLLKFEAEGPIICNFFEISRAIYLNSERSEQFL